MSEGRAIQYIEMDSRDVSIFVERQREIDKEMKNLETQVASILPEIQSRLDYCEEYVFSFNQGNMHPSDVEEALSRLREDIDKCGYKSRVAYSQPQNRKENYQLIISKNKK